MKSIYIIGSLRNRDLVIEVGNRLRAIGIEGFDDWLSPGQEADDKWKEYSEARGQNYLEALNSWAAKHVYEFDKFHLDRCDGAILLPPAGKSCHLEAGYMIGKGKPLWVLLDEAAKLSENWHWLTGLYEGEGSISYNRDRKKRPRSLVLSVTSTDSDIIARLYNVSKVGKVQGPYFPTANNLIKKPDIVKANWRWTVYKKEDILYVIRGMWEILGDRRKEQIINTLNKIGMDDTVIKKGDSPHEFRFDVMIQFATGWYYDIDQIIEEVMAYENV